MRRKGFTLIELSVVIVLLAMFAAAIVPNVVAVVRGSQRRAYRVSVLTLVHQARVESVTQGKTVSLAYRDNAFRISTTQNDQESVIKSVPSIDGVEASHFSRAGQETADAEWTVAFYPDGSCEGGAFQFDEGQDSQTVTIDRRRGSVSVADGTSVPSSGAEEEWDAGGYVQATG